MIEQPKEHIKIIRNFIKYRAANQGMNLTQFMSKVAEKYNRNPDVSNYSRKIRRGTLSLLEFLEILDILNVELELKEN